MKKITSLIFVLSLFLFSCNNNNDGKTDTAKTDTSKAAGQPAAKDATPAAMPDTAAINKAWMAFSTPGDMHKWMEKTNGTWEADVSSWMAADAPPTTSKAVNVQSSVLGGRYVSGKFTGSMMGQPFNGMSLMGYDNAKKMFVSTWVDDMGSGIVHMTGTYNEATKTLSLKGHQTDFMTGKDSDLREELVMIDDNSYKMTMYGAGFDGKEMKFMEGTFKKKK